MQTTNVAVKVEGVEGVKTEGGVKMEAPPPLTTTNIRSVEHLQKLTTEANVRRKQHIEAKQQKAKRNEIAREHKIEEQKKKTAENVVFDLAF